MLFAFVRFFEPLIFDRLQSGHVWSFLTSGRHCAIFTENAVIGQPPCTTSSARLGQLGQVTKYRLWGTYTVNSVLIETSPITWYSLCSVLGFEYRSFVQRPVGIRDTWVRIGTSPAAQFRHPVLIVLVVNFFLCFVEFWICPALRRRYELESPPVGICVFGDVRRYGV